MTYVVTVPEDVAGISHTYRPIKAAISLFMDAHDQAPLILPKLQDQYSLTLRCPSVSRWGRESFALFFCYKYGGYYVYGYVYSVAPQITQDTPPTIVDAPLTLIMRMLWGACFCSF